MTDEHKKKSANALDDKSSTVSRQTAVVLSLSALLVGFLAGTIFGVMKTSPLSGGSSNVSQTAIGKQPPIEMFQALEAEAAKNPQTAEVWTQLGNAYFDADQYGKAIVAYEKSLAIDPANPNVWTDLGVMYRLDKQPEKAVEMFSKAMALDPKHEVSRMNKGIVLLYDLQDEPGAVEAWEALLEINPLATFGDGQTVDERVRHYKEGHDNKEEGQK
ncbi:tetratricopeptide repeat protein [Desulfococcus sp.]|uniref:tetratricopeptide repeat protein n=1 Tax=Desulfococcus sp. TaxID=2025834 RepID=UPI0035946420